VFIDTPIVEAGCPSCGVVTSRVHQRTTQRVRDVPFDGQVTLWWVKKRWRCTEALCKRATFTEHTDEVPPYARLTTRLKERIVTALAGEVRCVDAVAAELGVSWPTAMRQLSTAMAAQAAATAARPVLVHSLGIDEHRFRTVRWYKDDADGSWRRVEPWMTTFINLATGQVIGVVDGRDSAAVKTVAEGPSPVVAPPGAGGRDRPPPDYAEVLVKPRNIVRARGSTDVRIFLGLTLGVNGDYKAR
jgi:transposase